MVRTNGRTGKARNCGLLGRRRNSCQGVENEVKCVVCRQTDAVLDEQVSQVITVAGRSVGNVEL